MNSKEEPADAEARVARETETGWASTKPTTGGTKYHYYEAGVSVCSYQRKPGTLSWASKQTASITNGLCSSCQNTLEKRVKELALSLRKQHNDTKQQARQLGLDPEDLAAGFGRRTADQRGTDRNYQRGEYEGGPGIDYDPRC